MSLLLTLNIFYTCVSIVNFDHVNAGWYVTLERVESNPSKSIDFKRLCSFSETKMFDNFCESIREECMYIIVHTVAKKMFGYLLLWVKQNNGKPLQ